MWGQPFVAEPGTCELNSEIKEEIKDYGIHIEKMRELVQDGRFKVNCTRILLILRILLDIDSLEQPSLRNQWTSSTPT